MINTMDANDAPNESSDVAESVPHHSNNISTPAAAPFNNEFGNADLIIRSSDKVDFYVHKLLLRMASSVFADMFIVAQADMPNQIPALQIVDVVEPSSIMDRILRICYPVKEVDDSETSVTKVAEVLRASLKYEMGKATVIMKKELLAYVSTDPISVYATACALDLEYEARQAATTWRAQYLQDHPHCSSCGYLGVQWERIHRGSRRRGWKRCYHCKAQFISDTQITFEKSVGGNIDRAVMQQATAGHLHRLIQFVMSGVDATFCSPPPHNDNDDDPLLPSDLRRRYPFVNFPISDITIQSIDHIDLPAHTSILAYANALGILRRREENSPIIRLDEDSRTLATLLQLCYPFAESHVGPGSCSVSLIARVRKAAENYGMHTVSRAVTKLMSEQGRHSPLDVFFTAKRYGWACDAKLAASQCLREGWENIEGPGAYRKEMESVSAEVYLTILEMWYDNGGRGSPFSAFFSI